MVVPVVVAVVVLPFAPLFTVVLEVAGVAS
jgi:hypothetical protein